MLVLSLPYNNYWLWLSALKFHIGASLVCVCERVRVYLRYLICVSALIWCSEKAGEEMQDKQNLRACLSVFKCGESQVIFFNKAIWDFLFVWGFVCCLFSALD